MKKTIGKIVGVLVFIIILLWPMDPAFFPVQATAAATALMVVWWITEAIPIQATALLPIVLFPTLGVLTASEATAPYADKVIFLFMGGFIIAMSMQRWGLHERIALAILNKAGSNSRMLILGFMIATAFLSMWISNTATTTTAPDCGVYSAHAVSTPILSKYHRYEYNGSFVLKTVLSLKEVFHPSMSTHSTFPSFLMSAITLSISTPSAKEIVSI